MQPWARAEDKEDFMEELQAECQCRVREYDVGTYGCSGQEEHLHSRKILRNL
jgi:hypothetical protein